MTKMTRTQWVMVGGVVAFGLLMLALVVWGVLTHDENGLLRGCAGAGGKIDYTGDCAEVRWGKTPLRVKAEGGDAWQRDGLVDAIHSLNDEIGFPLLRYVTEVEPAEVSVNFDEPAEAGSLPYAGRVQHYAAPLAALGAAMQRCEVKLKNVALADTAPAVLRHELGHVLGLAHDPEDNSLMTDKGLVPGRFYPLTDDDRALIARHYRDQIHDDNH